MRWSECRAKLEKGARRASAADLRLARAGGDGGESTHQGLGKRHKHHSWTGGRSFGEIAPAGWRHGAGLASVGLQQRPAPPREGGRENSFEQATLVHTTEEITKDQSTCLFKTADLSVGDFLSSSTLKTTASVKQNGMVEKAIPELHLAA